MPRRISDFSIYYETINEICSYYTTIVLFSMFFLCILFGESFYIRRESPDNPWGFMSLDGLKIIYLGIGINLYLNFFHNLEEEVCNICTRIHFQFFSLDFVGPCPPESHSFYHELPEVFQYGIVLLSLGVISFCIFF